MLLDLQVVGLAYDVAGIFTLGVQAVLRVTNAFGATARLRDETDTMWDGNSELRRYLVESSIDTTVGSSLLVLGFVFQAVAVMGRETELTHNWVLIGLLTLFLLVYWCLLRGRWSKCLVRKVEQASDR